MAHAFQGLVVLQDPRAVPWPSAQLVPTVALGPLRAPFAPSVSRVLLDLLRVLVRERSSLMKGVVCPLRARECALMVSGFAFL
jgi:hypothetical protein